MKALGEPTSNVQLLDDEALLGAVANRDQQAFAELYDRYDRLAYFIAFDVLQERQSAEDAVQEGFLKIWRAAGGFDPQRGSARGWIRTVIQNGAISRQRGKAGRARLDVPLDITVALSADHDPHTIAEASERSSSVHQTLATLPSPQRIAVELAYFAGLTCQEIAAATDTPTGTVKSRLRLGMQKMRELLAPPAAVAV